MNTEEIRESYKPLNINLLLVGESPPASGGFFYKKSHMTTYTSRAFEKAFGRSFSDHLSFLNFFRDKGCYLEDLSHIPVDDKPSSERKKILQDSIHNFSLCLKQDNPQIIVIVLKKIEGYVKEAIDLAKITCPVYTLPFPGNGHQNKFIHELTDILEGNLK